MSIKLSSPATREFWEIPVLFEDEHLLALDQPAGIPTSPEAGQFEGRPGLMKLLHAAIAEKKPWARERNLDYLMNAHSPDPETSGVILLAKNKSASVALSNLFGSGKIAEKYIVLVRGEPLENQFEVNAKIAPHPVTPGLMRVDSKDGKPSQTKFEVLENFPRHGYALLQCEPLIERTHQIRVHLQHIDLKIVGDELYGGKPLWLSRLKKDYRLKPGREERPLISRAALHMEELQFPHPVTNETVSIKSECPKDLKVALKYLRQFAV
ncbi:MAG TPA: pseudouridine synthase [Verrucomicrobiae bacterium]|nr:pseudouridine synthase [Verrucomicrobiae bacterium]